MTDLPAQLPDLYPGFDTRIIDANGLQIFTRAGGSGPALLLLHGYPQTHVCWHKIAVELASHFSVVAMDLRGYGHSSAPAGDSRHTMYSKRAMALDCVAVMDAFGFEKFSVLSHDRGARVGYRLALDHVARLHKLVTLDIVPTSDAWDSMDYKGAMSKFHWSFLAQGAPFPEQLIEAAADVWHEHLLKSWAASGDLSVFSPDALEHYRQSYRQPSRIHAMSEDYRAGYTIDYQLDQADLQSGRRIECPVLVLWGQRRSVGVVTNPLETWRKWCDQVEGSAIDSGHFLAEENPTDTLAAVLQFLRS